MQKNEIISHYMSRFTQCHDKLGGVTVIVPEEYLVALAFLGLPKRCHIYLDWVNGRQKLPSWEKLWFDLVQEEIRWNNRDGASYKEEEEEFALVSKGNKAKGKKSQGEAPSSQEGK